MRVVSLVPSLTETLLEAKAQVVGRTRYCIHPSLAVSSIPKVGGTKDLSLKKLSELKPDLLILDQEENLPWMKSEAPCEVLLSHITSIKDMVQFSETLWQKLNLPLLKEMHLRWLEVEKSPNARWTWDKVPGSVESWIRVDTDKTDIQKLVYIIWKNPWMCVSEGTFIYDVLTKLGAKEHLYLQEGKYPTLKEEALKNHICLFSSEPYPFAKHKTQLPIWAPNGSLVNGEGFSWFGIRSLRFLEKHLGLV